MVVTHPDVVEAVFIGDVIQEKEGCKEKISKDQNALYMYEYDCHTVISCENEYDYYCLKNEYR